MCVKHSPLGGDIGPECVLEALNLFSESCLQLQRRAFGVGRLRSSCQLTSVRAQGSQQGPGSSPKLCTAHSPLRNLLPSKKLVMVFL